MENFWTSNKTINGLRHFVLVNETREQGKITFLMVSVLDSEIYLKTTFPSTKCRVAENGFPCLVFKPSLISI